ncbi:unnamed protein product, partial [marine sediment metagenome]
MANDLTEDYVLGGNIDAAATATWNEDPGNPGTYFGFDPVGDHTTPFTGSFDGGGYTITSLTINRPTESYIGLFGETDCGDIEDVGLVTCSISGEGYVGALVGKGTSTGISDCYATGAIDGTLDYVGGLIGDALTAIEDCYSTCTVTVTGGASKIVYCGGFVGNVYTEETITDCYSTGNVTITSDSYIRAIGGFVGETSGVTITKCFATGDVTATAGDKIESIGGFAGSFDTETITNSYATGDITVLANDIAWGDIGGFVGYFSDTVIDDCYSIGSITE